MTASLTRDITECIAALDFRALPTRTVAITKQSPLDATGVMLAASTLGDQSRAFADIVRKCGGRRESTVLGFNFKAPAPWAAFVNGSMAHALDFEGRL